MLKVSRLLATGLEILVANAKFSVALATSWSQFRTLIMGKRKIGPSFFVRLILTIIWCAPFTLLEDF